MSLFAPKASGSIFSNSQTSLFSRKQPVNNQGNLTVPPAKKPTHNIFGPPPVECKMFDEQQANSKKEQCKGKNQLIALCTNPECQCAFICSKKQCDKCKNDSHLTCQRVQIEGLSRLISQHANKTKDFYYSIMEATQKVQLRLAQLKQQIQGLFYHGDLEGQYKKTIKKIYTSSNIFAGGQKISGQEVKELYNRLRRKSDHGDAADQYLFLKGYQKQINTIKDTISKTYKSLKSYWISKEIHSINEVKQESHKYFDSVIIPSNTQFSSLNKQIYVLQSLNKPAELQLLFRASEHEFKAEEFHKNCDGIQDTFTLVQTEFGKVIGGFSHYKWNEVADGEWVNDKYWNSFLIMLDEEKKFNPCCSQKLIKCHSTMGPCFGEDLIIPDKCNEKFSSSAFPQTYNTIFTLFPKNQDTTQLFCGAKEGNQFKIKEYEVFKVIFKQ